MQDYAQWSELRSVGGEVRWRICSGSAAVAPSDLLDITAHEPRQLSCFLNQSGRELLGGQKVLHHCSRALVPRLSLLMLHRTAHIGE